MEPSCQISIRRNSSSGRENVGGKNQSSAEISFLLNSVFDDMPATEFEQLFELGDGGICAKNEEWDAGKKVVLAFFEYMSGTEKDDEEQEVSFILNFKKFKSCPT
ncbi:hypothetical protein TNCT_4871 [Trichonephila clavata]|uniref:Uncharacterized protein n=1 Tax=Trichonephila clavata TaxID=2740835 RepID=A0A8X6HX78_TRICU|nr:hypothetical protein TNCT_4871 [Trichonephila clavata]